MVAAAAVVLGGAEADGDFFYLVSGPDLMHSAGVFTHQVGITRIHILHPNTSCW